MPLKARFTLLIFSALLALRLISVFTVYPGNAPDEVGHLLMVAGMSHGHHLTLKEEWKYNGYPYSVYNPLAYVPAAVTLWAASWIDPTINPIVEGKTNIPHKEDYAARLGGLAWFALFAVFLLKLTQNLPAFERFSAVAALSLIPQLTYVQSYVNLDAMGVAVFVYLIWALREERLGHLAIASFLLGCAKMNFLCILPLPVLVLWGRHLRQPRLAILEVVRSVVLPMALSALWLVYNYWINTREYGSVLGFTALTQLYQVQPAGDRVFTWHFYNTSIESAFALFGWMNQAMPRAYFALWYYLFFPLGTVALFGFNLRRGYTAEQRGWHLGFLAVFIANFTLHYLASYTNGYQPQGRYLFPAILITQGYLVALVVSIGKKSRSLEWVLLSALCFVMICSAAQGISRASLNPYHMGFFPDEEGSPPQSK